MSAAMDDANELERLRARADAINQRLVAVLHERAALCRRIGAWKRARGLPGPDPARERAMLEMLLRDLPHDGFSREALAAILREVFAASRAIVSET